MILWTIHKCSKKPATLVLCKIHYKALVENQASDYTYKDIFDGEHYNNLVQRGYFRNDTDVAIGLSTDSFQIFKKWGYDCWPILVINYNLPLEVRLEKQNLILCRAILGPSQPKDLDTFLFLLYEELHKLEDRVECIDGYDETKFQLHAYLMSICRDMPAIAKIARLKGMNGICLCRYCKIHGTNYSPIGSFNGHYYYLHEML